jgi:hypothetical protein
LFAIYEEISLLEITENTEKLQTYRQKTPGVTFKENARIVRPERANQVAQFHVR